MATTPALSKTDFEREVRVLVHLKADATAALHRAADAILKFAVAYRALHRQIGGNYERHVALRERLGVREDQHQRLMAIAEQAPTLAPLKRALPPALEPLYEIARLARDGHGERRLRRAVERGEITPTTGIREIRALRQSTRPTHAKPRAKKAPVERRASSSSLEFAIDGDEGLTPEAVEQFKAELVTLVEKYGLRLRTGEGLDRRADPQPPLDGEGDERARLDRIFAAPMVNRVISDEDVAALPDKSRDELQRELMECYERHRAAWNTDDAEAVIDKDERERLHGDLSIELLQIGAKHGVPRAIAALKGELSPEVEKTYAFVKPYLERDRARRKRQEGGGEQPKRPRRSARKEVEPK